MTQGKQIVIMAIALVMVIAGGAFIMRGSTTSLDRSGEKLSGEDAEKLVTVELAGTIQGVVGLEIGQGVYRSSNTKSDCTWQRTEIGQPTQSGSGEGTFEVELAKDLVQFISRDCDPWQLIKPR